TPDADTDRDAARAPRRGRELEPRFERPRRPARGSRFGPSEAGTSYSPVQLSSTREPDVDLDAEVDAIVNALREAGPTGLERRVLRRRVKCRPWGTGGWAAGSTAPRGGRGASATRCRPRSCGVRSAPRAAGGTSSRSARGRP